MSSEAWWKLRLILVPTDVMIHMVDDHGLTFFNSKKTLQELVFTHKSLSNMLLKVLSMFQTYLNFFPNQLERMCWMKENNMLSSDRLM